MAAAILDIIVGLYQAITQQEKVVEDQEESLELMNEANTFLDIERLTGVIMREATEQLATARAILEDLYAQLDRALDLWGRAVASDNTEELSVPAGPQPADSAPAQPIVQETPSPLSKHSNAPPDLDNPRVGSRMRHTQQWQDWLEAPSIHNPLVLGLSQQPTRWWMKDQTQYGLCQLDEQVQLETSARAAQFNRYRTPAPSPTPNLARLGPFIQEVRQAQQRRLLSSALPLPPVPGQLSHNRWARSCSDDFWLDEDFDPEFWQKNLRPGDIWTEPRRFPIPDDDGISPKTMPLRLTRRAGPAGAGTFSAAVAAARNNRDGRGSYAERTLRVGGTSPADYFPATGTKKVDFRALMTPKR